MNTKITSFFNDLSPFLIHSVEPIAHDLDTDQVLLQKIYQQFILYQSLHLMIPEEMGGLGGDRSEWIHYNDLMAQHSGALLFLQAQHQFVVSQLKKFIQQDNIKLILKQIVKENKGIGLSVVATRNVLQVKRHDHGFTLHGTLPWVTGFTFFSKLLLIFDFEESIYYTFLPFENSQSQGGRIAISSPIKTAVFYSVNTVKVSLENWQISEKSIIASIPLCDHQPIEHPTIYAFVGVAKALIKIAMQGKFKNEPLAVKAHHQLTSDTERYQKHIQNQDMDPLKLRAMGLSLVENCSQFARFNCSAESILTSHPLNRICREIWQYTVSGYTHPQFEAYINTLSPSFF